MDFWDFFAAARRVLKPGGLLFTSVPNQEYGFAKAHGSMLSFEHPSACTNLHWVALHARHGFAVREVRLFHEHSTMLVCEMLPAPQAPFVMDARGITRALVRDYTRAVEARTRAILAAADGSKANWLFGAHNNARLRAFLDHFVDGRHRPDQSGELVLRGDEPFRRGRHGSRCGRLERAHRRYG